MMPVDCAQILDSPLMQQIVRVESGGNPFAIGVVGGALVRQPRNLPEAVATAQSLEAMGRNYSVGPGQINRVHFKRLGWHQNIESGFDVCQNIRASLGVLQTCHDMAVRAGYPVTSQPGTYGAIHASLSCYYSGDLLTGARLGYVAKVLGAQSAVAPQQKRRAKAAPSMMLNQPK